MKIKKAMAPTTARAIALFAVCLVCLVLIWTGVVNAQQRNPLLIPGKRTLYQKVITHPGAKLFGMDGDSVRVLEEWIKPFTVYYVYERTAVAGEPWLEVGLSSTGGPTGWINGAKASDWNQALTLVFTERTGRRPALFFRNMNSLQTVAGSPTPRKQTSELISQFSAIQSGEMSQPENFPLLAVEPPGEAVSEKRFYLIPIFNALELFEGVKFLEVASIDPGSGQLPVDAELKTAIVFVIDTTVSMKPYIERTREAVRKIYDAIDEAGLSDKVAFGLVAYRNSTRKTPGLIYEARVLSDLRDGRERDKFEFALAQTHMQRKMVI